MTVTGDLPRRAFVAHVMGLPVSVHGRGPPARASTVATLVEDAFTQLRADDETFSTYRESSAVSRIRRGELTIHDAGQRVRRVAVLCDVAEQRTGGTFCAWLPDPSGKVAFDPTGLVKGWAVEQAFDELTGRLVSLGAQQDAHDVLISAGGDVLVGCERTDTPDWVVGVEDPRDRTRVVLNVTLRRGAVATSGTAARGTHILDPATGRPVAGLLSATVIGPSLTWADVYATAAFVRGEGALDWVATLPGHAAAVVTLAGDVRTRSSSVTQP